MIINLDKTEMDAEIISCIVNEIIACDKRFMRIAFVGVKKRKERLAFIEIQKQTGCSINFFDDFEKAKQWTLPK